MFGITYGIDHLTFTERRIVVLERQNMGFKDDLHICLKFLLGFMVMAAAAVLIAIMIGR